MGEKGNCVPHSLLMGLWFPRGKLWFITYAVDEAALVVNDHSSILAILIKVYTSRIKSQIWDLIK